MYQKVSTQLNFVEREKKVLDFWNEHNIFEKSIQEKAGLPTYTFYDGPPTANGKPHIGHVLTRVIKDMIPRYRTMKGNKILRKAGWDTHGLPVEIEIEKKLGLDGKEGIEAFGLEPFVKACKESVWQYKEMWEDFSATVGFWADMDDPYVTYHDDYIESIWWSLKEIWNKGYLYEGHKITPYCPRCGTSLSSHEVAQGYKDLKEKSVIAKFKAVDEENTYILAWTTTPWTLPSNVALAVNPKETYAKVELNGDYFILAEALISTVFGELVDVNVVESYLGKTLEYKEYVPLFDFAEVTKKGFYITCADFVTLSDGTGIVHIAPAFGEDDNRVGQAYDLPFVQLVTGKGEFIKGVTPWDDIFVKDADPKIIDYLEEKGKLFSALEYEHSYPHCWRCDTALLYYAKDSWFIKTTAVKDDMIANNNKINWLPESIGKKRFGDWLENLVDWGISRDRYWGTPLPVWQCECGHQHCVGSIAELKSMSKDCPEEIELHRPYIDAVHITCEKCGNDHMTRVLPVIDCWYDSGAMPFAQWHYPFENQEVFKDNFPADFISEAVDQTRGWFYSLLAISTLLFNEPAYKNVIVLGLVQDENGQKMSKSKGNAVDPFDALNTYGSDPIRWYFYANSAPWLPNKFYGDAVVEYQRKFLGTFWNTYAFYILYAEIDQFDPTQYTMDKSQLNLMDKWLLSKLNTLIKTVDNFLDSYKITESTRAIQSFVDDLSNWYVRRSRERFWAKGMEQDKINAYMTLNEALVTLSKLCAPMIPFMTENIYQNMVRTVDSSAPESIHLCDYPVWDEMMIDDSLEEQMDTVLNVVVAGRACRNQASIKNRQPLANMFVQSIHTLDEAFKEIIKEELNVKSVEFKDDLSSFTSYAFKPQLRTVGPKYGKLLNQIRQTLAEIDGNKAMAELNEKDSLTFEFGDDVVVLTKEDLLIESAKQEGFEAQSEKGVTVAIDTALTPELIEEGFVREITSKIQTMRKEADFEVMDHIVVAYSDNTVLLPIIEKNLEFIKEDTLADDMILSEDSGEYQKEWSINGETLVLSVKRIQ